MRHVRFAKACRECGVDGNVPYRTVVGVRVPLCNACAGDYQRVKLIDMGKATPAVMSARERFA